MNTTLFYCLFLYFLPSFSKESGFLHTHRKESLHFPQVELMLSTSSATAITFDHWTPINVSSVMC